MGLVDGRVVVVTGAGHGIGRAHALAFAAEGARVVVNDIGAGPAKEVVHAITAAGGEAVVSGADIGDWDGARSLIQTAVDRFGGLDVLVNNAGFVRDDVLVDTREGEWDAVVRVHLKGHFATLAARDALLARPVRGGRSGRRPHHHHQLGGRDAGHRRAGQRFRGQSSASPPSPWSARTSWAATASRSTRSLQPPAPG